MIKPIAITLKKGGLLSMNLKDKKITPTITVIPSKSLKIKRVLESIAKI